MNAELIKWDKIRSEIAECQDIVKLTKLSYSLDAIQKWSKQAGQSLEVQNEIAEYRLRLDRKRGQWVEENIPKEGQLRQGPVAKNSCGTPTLTEAGIGHNESPKLRAIAAVPEEEFEEHIAKTKAEKKELTSASVYRLHKKRSITVPPLPTEKYRVLYADPPWKYGNTMPDYFKEQADHYPLLTVAEICDLPVKDIVEDNAVLFLWTTSPILEESFQVIRSWGFTYRASFVWDKVKHNMGHYNSVRHEFLLVGVRGSCQPDVQKLFDSVVTEERTEHSKKPELFYEIIETLYTHGKRIELFSRKTRKGWSQWGNEVS